MHLVISNSILSSHQPSGVTLQAALDKIAPWVIEHTANGKEAEFLVAFVDAAELSRASALPTKREKGRFVRDAPCESRAVTGCLTLLTLFVHFDRQPAHNN